MPLSFVTIVETGSITRAAEKLSLAKSAVSQNLKRLEEELGVQLARRTTRRLTLTPAGERYYQRCKDVLTLSKQAATEMETFGAKPSGPMTITAPHALIAPLIAPAMASLARQYPDLRPTLIADDTRLDLVADQIDLSVSVGKLSDSTLRARRIGELRDVLCAAPSLLANAPSRGDPAFADWIRSMSYIAHTREPSVIEHKIPASTLSKEARLDFDPVFRGNTIEAIAALTRQGLGISLLPDISISDELSSGRLICLCDEVLPDPTPVYAVHPYDAMVPKSVAAAIDALRTAFATVKREAAVRSGRTGLQ
ncbi:LysR family transcriptional regulator [uncultured Roseibium sp.]|uniref:LysR family transcriptional regulator n=1 Tax=uncultured Roseibium sp. TaxID=1936171 RepID=UPI0026292BD0|nr:LysR family transcriptional regulator [uncultured Roseibium sp.]